MVAAGRGHIWGTYAFMGLLLRWIVCRAQKKRICKAVCDACHANWQRATYIRAGGIKRQYTDVGEDHPIVHAAQVVDCDKRRMTLRLRSALLRSPLGVVRAVTKML